MAAVVALAGCGVLILRRSPKSILAGVLGLSGVVGAIWFVAPRETLERIASISGQLQNGDLNQRVNIWDAGWRAFLEAPLCGHGAGSFATVSRLAPIDTAHNTILAMLVEGGLFSLVIATAIVAVTVRSISATLGALRIALMTLMAVWFISSLIGTVGESRTTWLLLGMIAVSQRLGEVQADKLEYAFSDPEPTANLSLAERFQ